MLSRNIELVFSHASAERMIDGLKKRRVFRSSDSKQSISHREVGEQYYYLLSRKIDGCFSLEETLNMHDEMLCLCKSYDSLPADLFQLLVKYADDVLRIENGFPVCRRERILSWRFVTLKHGQDLFTCAYLAFLKVTGSLPAPAAFGWPAIIETDDARLKNVLQKGIAENHFHLTGSTRVFSLSWIALMNYPEKIHYFFSILGLGDNPFAVNRSKSISFSSGDQVMSWNEQLQYAAWLRAKLFERAYDYRPCITIDDFLQFETRFEKTSSLIQDIRTLQKLYGRLFSRTDYQVSYLDYALCTECTLPDPDDDERLLCGERELLYRLFRMCFSNELGEEEKDLFYVYLLIKNRFRKEMIQANKEVGFANFSLYQDRKDTFWESIPAYWYEAQRLAVNATLKGGDVKTLEMRTQPAKTHGENYAFVRAEDDTVLFSGKAEPRHDAEANLITDAQLADERGSLPFFYVPHFIKRKLLKPSDGGAFNMAQPRNSDVRENASRRARELAVSLSKSDYLCSRIRGIDAASFEIGCRPETFATEFRFLSGFAPDRIDESSLMNPARFMPRLNMTYHAGEDFLDISDGLRAVDEAVLFLNLSRGSRIGHALALGVDPALHYKMKNCHITLSKQDMLDNCVWIMKRGCELGVSIDYNLNETLRSTSEELLDEIYGQSMKRSELKLTIDDYYASWKLRGDHPGCYSSSFIFAHPYREQMQFMCKDTISYKYYKSFIGSEEYRLYRDNPNICGFMYYYHYGYAERMIGMQTCSREVDCAYIELMRQLQDRMQKMISAKGIVIECNLSSNQLIGTFSRYDRHPIFRFNRYLLDGSDRKDNISVILSTDDQGVFDTSLENEYALLADAMAKARDENGQRLYSDDVIYGYLDHVREMGIIHTFPAAATAF